MRVGLVPLDDRSNSRLLPSLVAQVAGVRLDVPPSDAVGGLHRRGDHRLLEQWLGEVAGELDGLVISVDQLAAADARGPDDPIAAVKSLETLRTIRRRLPDLSVLGFALSDRPLVPPNMPEAERWLGLVEQRQVGRDVAQELSTAEGEVDEDVRRGLMTRRLGAHNAALTAVALAAEGTFDLLLVGSGHAAADPLQRAKRAWLSGWQRLLGVGPMQPGTDELASVLLARLFLAQADRRPSIGFYCPVPDAEKRPAPGEEGTVSRTVLRTVRALGAEVVESDADIVLALHPPAADGAAVRSDPERAALDLADELVRLHTIGVPVALVDVDTAARGVLVDRLHSRVELTRLSSFGGGEPAGDVVGGALAHACARLVGAGEESTSAHEELLVRRFLDGWAYQGKVRERARRRLSSNDEPADVARVENEIERDLTSALGQLPSFSGRFRIVPGSVRLPWGRIDECEFDVERVDVPVAARR